MRRITESRLHPIWKTDDNDLERSFIAAINGYGLALLE